MKTEELEALRELFTEPERSLVSEPFTDEMARLSNAYVLAVQREQALAARDAVPRLLAEREALLNALRPFAEGAGAMTYRMRMAEYGLEHVADQTEAAAAAIRLAES